VGVSLGSAKRKTGSDWAGNEGKCGCRRGEKKRKKKENVTAGLDQVSVLLSSPE